MGWKLKATKNNGKGFEHLVAISAVTGRVKLERIEDGVKIIAGNQTVRQKQPVDFIGTTDDGRAVMIDAKSCSAVNSFPLANVAPHQREAIIQHGSRGAVAGLLIESIANSSIYWVSWKLLLQCEAKSIQWEGMRYVGSNMARVNWDAVLAA